MPYNPYDIYDEEPVAAKKTSSGYDPYAGYDEATPEPMVPAKEEAPKEASADFTDLFNAPSFQKMTEEEKKQVIQAEVDRLGISSKRKIYEEVKSAGINTPGEYRQVERDDTTEKLYQDYINAPATQKRIYERSQLELTSPSYQGPASLLGSESAQQDINRREELRRTTPNTPYVTANEVVGNLLPLAAGGLASAGIKGAVGAGASAATTAAPAAATLGTKAALGQVAKDAALAGAETFVTQGAEQNAGESFFDVLKKRAEAALTSALTTAGISGIGRGAAAAYGKAPTVERNVVKDVQATVGLDPNKIATAAEIRAAQSKGQDLLAQRAAIAEKSGVNVTPMELAASGGGDQAAIRFAEAQARGGKSLAADMGQARITGGENAAATLGVARETPATSLATLEGVSGVAKRAVGKTEQLAEDVAGIQAGITPSVAPQAALAEGLGAASTEINKTVRDAYNAGMEVAGATPVNPRVLPGLPAVKTKAEQTILESSPTVQKLLASKAEGTPMSLLELKREIDRLDSEITRGADRSLGNSSALPEEVWGSLGKYKDDLQKTYAEAVAQLPEDAQKVLRSGDDAYRTLKAGERTVDVAGGIETAAWQKVLGNKLDAEKATVADIGKVVFDPVRVNDAGTQLNALRGYLTKGGQETAAGELDNTMSSILVQEADRLAKGDIAKLEAVANDPRKLKGYFDQLPNARQELDNLIAARKEAVQVLDTEGRNLLPNAYEPLELSVSKSYANTAATAVKRIKDIGTRLSTITKNPTELVTTMAANPEVADDFLAFTAKQGPEKAGKIRQAVRDVYVNSVLGKLNVSKELKPRIEFNGIIDVVNQKNEKALTKILGTDFVDKLKAVQDASAAMEGASRRALELADPTTARAIQGASRAASIGAIGTAAAVNTAVTDVLKLGYGKRYSKAFMDAMSNPDTFMEILGNEATKGKLEKLNELNKATVRRVMGDYSKHVLVGTAATNAATAGED